MHDNFLRYFDEVARQGSIRKAAAVLNVASTSVNRKIISTEEALGIRLFDRTASGVTLTSAGIVVLEHCRNTLFDYERIRLLISDIRDMRTGHIDIMALDSIALGVLPDALKRFSEAYPEVTFSVSTAQPDEIVKAVAKRETDIGLTFCNDLHPDTRTLAQKAAPIGVVMPADHPLAERSKLTVADIAAYPMVRSIDARKGDSIIDQIVSDVAESLSTRLFTNSLPMAKRMILRRRGIGLYTKLGFLDEIEAGTLSFAQLDVDVLQNLKIGVIVSAHANLAPVKHLVCVELAKAFRSVRLDS
ncbi:LysR family transcriptional regulator [Pelagibius litoralis]|uniref:LysR family transcriptional regulator n=1 Tax=Pelagibius litoralis TaxID=374515 RepID=A0A967KIP5_9PROT|nr:LysR family transcriptional regulator [Pelagibius litoralis]NIA72511.1 LysR family transcriptional regulator [Pelagibius litoralis]